MRYLISLLLLVGCGSESELYIVAGQSNAVRCDWSEFKIINIARGAHTIDDLIQAFHHDFKEADGIFFVHGESDSKLMTDPDYYVERVEFYRNLISNQVGKDLNLYISTVGYNLEHPKEHFDLIRDKVNSIENDKWIVVYNDVQFYPEWDLLIDQVHFTEEGCKLMTEAFK